ncbi:RNA polymerase sigma factor, sigma-70 family [Catalinimonas alkaloidigena]|uniref:RNA polymerase sigma factor, sigma-70 family n=1 Tax=Catalinimonas alkaloidigena TaxID=1075417 RepID=A0A1G8YBR1_9BACT|nr:sigma-70 family RNA polymerase sigma factor [Catalinimonas alkaloidigena]SDK00103.1 RNA polymerase sigma factor, sigma-70 family [Catalinimonas alkaloidigena]
MNHHPPFPDDATLWQGFQRGDAQAFETLFRRHYAPLIRYGWKLSHNRMLAEEAVQSIFSHLWAQRAHLKSIEAVRAYLYTAVRHAVLKEQLRAGRFHTFAGEDTSHGAIQFSQEDALIHEEAHRQKRDQLLAAVNALTPRQREAVYLKFYENLSHEEIAAVLHINVQSVTNLIFRAMHLLRQSTPLKRLLESLCLIGYWIVS